MSYFTSLWSYLLASSPFLLFGLIVSGIIKAYLPKEKIQKWLGKNSIWTVIKASLVGIPLPLCSCSVIPTAVTLRKSGASKAATSAFLISTPESSIDSISMTYALMDFPMTIARPLAAFISATLAGVMQSIFNKDESNSQSEEAAPHSCCQTEKKEEKSEISFGEKIKSGLKFSFFDLMEDISFWLALGISVGALIDWLIPPQFFESLGSMESKFLILGIGVPLYICASATTPIAAALIMKGIGPGSALILLLVGPATNMSNLIILKKYLGTKGIIINVIAIVTVALLFSFMADAFYQHIPIQLSLGENSEHHHEIPFWNLIKMASAVIFSLLLLRALYKEHIHHRINS